MPDAPIPVTLGFVGRASLSVGLTCGVGALVAWLVGSGSPRGHSTAGAAVVLLTLAVAHLLVAWLALREIERQYSSTGRRGR